MKLQRFRLATDEIIAARFDADDALIAAAEDVLDLYYGVSDHHLANELAAALEEGTATAIAPVDPSKIVCIGLNYRKHAEEMNKTIPAEPVVFLKPSTALIGPGDEIELPADSKEVHHEGELAIIIGSPARNVSEANAMEHVLGWTIMNDVTARDIQRREGTYTRAKGYDTFAPLGPAIITSGEPKDFTIETLVNGERRQFSSCDDLIFQVPYLIAHLSRIMTLLPGDVIATGTPSGVGPIRDGDVVTVRIEGIGELSNPVVASPVR